MNCCNFPNNNLYDYIELMNLWSEYNRAWLEIYLNWYQFYLPKQ